MRLASVRSRLGPYACGVPLGACLFGAAEFAFAFPDPLPSFLERASRNDEVAQALGTPLWRLPWWSGKVTGKEVSASVPVVGSRGWGTLRAKAYRFAAEKPWEAFVLEVELSSATVDLLGQPAPPPQG